MRKRTPDVIEVKTIDYKGRKVSLCVDGKGTFYAEVNHDRIEANTLNTLTARVKRAIDRAGAISVAGTIVRDHWDEPPTFEDVRIIGYHAGHRQPIIIDSDGDQSYYSSHDGMMARQLTPDEREKYTAAWNTKKAAEEALETLTLEIALDPVEAFRAAAAAIDGTTPESEEVENEE